MRAMLPEDLNPLQAMLPLRSGEAMKRRHNRLQPSHNRLIHVSYVPIASHG
jgi:hypothetical protein